MNSSASAAQRDGLCFHERVRMVQKNVLATNSVSVQCDEIGSGTVGGMVRRISEFLAWIPGTQNLGENGVAKVVCCSSS
jgi:hypothetical protein